jgi:hypothetical protein
MTDPSFALPNRLASFDYVVGTSGATSCVVPPLCEVPAGAFLLGSDPARDECARTRGSEQPQHRLNLRALQIARFPVTVSEFAAFVRASGHAALKNWDWQQGLPDHPETNVSWHDALAYAPSPHCLKVLHAMVSTRFVYVLHHCRNDWGSPPKLA